MTDLYVPKKRNEPYRPSFDDSNYAQVFGDLARVLDGTTQSEDISLRLSTCRNVYLTINALFGVIREVLGHGQSPSLVSQAIYLLRLILRLPEGAVRHDRLQELGQVLHEIGLRMKVFADKQRAWENRAQLDRILQDAVGSVLDRVAADRLKRVLLKPRTHQKGKDLSDAWDGRWLELTQDTGSDWAADRFARLVRNGKTVDAVSRIVRAATEFIEHPEPEYRQASLFAHGSQQAPDDHWRVLYKSLCERAGDLGLVVSPAEDGPIAWHLAGHGECRIHVKPASEPESRQILLQLVDYLDHRSQELYQSLSDAFQPNISRTPMPPPFLIDLSDAFAIKGPTHKLAEVLGRTVVRNYGRSAPPMITVAMGQFGVPLSYYESRLGRYVDNDRRREIENLAKAALDAVASCSNPVLVLPELFLPAPTAEEIGEYARDKKITLIAGVEPVQGPEGPISQALIALPHVSSNLFQFKARNSPYELQYDYKSSAVHVIGGTDIGSFAVVVCSDLREFDLLAAVADAEFLIDTLFVCSYNSQPELFESFAIGDAARLYCHVAIANGCWSEKSPNTATSQGTVVCSPMAVSSKRVLTPQRTIPIALPQIGGVTPVLVVYELRIDELRSDKEKPGSGYMSPPHFRRTVPYPIVST